MFLALSGAIVTLAIFVGVLVFRAGVQHARILELERWRLSVRNDLHEISDILEAHGREQSRMSTLIDERTER